MNIHPPPPINVLATALCTAYGHVPDSLRQKLDQKAVIMQFVGYNFTQKGYRLYDDKRKIFICRDVIFNETDFGHSTKVQLKVEEEVGDSCSTEESDRKKSSDVRRSTPERKPPVHYHNEYAGIATAKHTALFATEVEEPTALKKGLEGDQLQTPNINL